MSIAEAIKTATERYQHGNLAEAEALYRKALASEPNHADALHGLGLIAYQTAQFDIAVDYFRRAIQARPRMAEAHNSLANVLRSKALVHEALAEYRAAVQLRADYFEAHYNLGTMLRETARAEEAIGCFRKALELQPQFVDAANDLGSALREVGRLDEAVPVLKHAIQQSPRFYKAHNNLGNAYKALGNFDEAETALRAALQLRPDIAEIHINLGNVLREKADLAGAIAATRDAIRLRPDLADAHQNLGSILLLAGQYAEGWPEHEWRWRCQNMGLGRAARERPQWDGANLNGRSILLHCDAGLGDAIQCARFIPMVADRGGQIAVECPQELHRMLRDLKGVSRLITADDPLPCFDVQCPLMSLPRAFSTTVQTIPTEIPYLAAEADLLKQWAQRLSNSPRPRVGLAWAGNPKHTHDRRRSLSLSMLAPLGGAGQITFHSLQLGDAAHEILTPLPQFRVIDHSRELIDFAETAALVMNLDLVISVDTSVAHLAGALGKPVWVMLPFAPDWRWMLGREDSPWYPTMRLFRQKTFGDWKGVIGRIAKALGDFQKM